MPLYVLVLFILFYQCEYLELISFVHKYSPLVNNILVQVAHQRNIIKWKSYVYIAID